MAERRAVRQILAATERATGRESVDEGVDREKPKVQEDQFGTVVQVLHVIEKLLGESGAAMDVEEEEKGENGVGRSVVVGVVAKP